MDLDNNNNNNNNNTNTVQNGSNSFKLSAFMGEHQQDVK
jgi:hypothetical protein